MSEMKMNATVKNKSAALKDKQTTGEAFGSILKHNLGALREWAPIAYRGEEIEGVHQARVSLRRMRSALGLFRKAIPRAITDPWSAEMSWIASTMGAARDLDVFISEGLKVTAGKIPLEAGEKKLTALAIQRREEAYRQVREMMDSDRYKKFMRDFPRWLDDAAWQDLNDLPEDIRRRMHRGIRLYAASMLNKRMSMTLGYGERIAEMDHVELHALRIECKKLRYALEFFMPLFSEKGMSSFTLHLKGLQDILGVMNDVSVMPGLLEKILAGSTDLETLEYAGAIIGWRSRQYEEVRGQLDARWEEFSSSAMPWMK
ncbi:MAG: CHAD domain-containing protein [Magnetococcales bacterium]|nr:CHAD domain-containing protein [Magnetococcales bacterium]